MSKPSLPGSITTWAKRPKCQIDGCENDAKFEYQYDDGTWKWRVRHGKIICTAHQKSSWHPYLRHRKDYCENVSGFLGFKCTTNIYWNGMLDVDHKNGNPSDNRKRNLQTLCKCCHAYKTNKNKDGQTPGRLALGIKS
jgi:hypothetical protein